MVGRAPVGRDRRDVLDVPDTPVNHEYLGQPGVNKGEQAAFPQARGVVLAACGTHAVFAARVVPTPSARPS